MPDSVALTHAPDPITPAAIADDLFCQNCGYNLRTLTGERCPECGESIAGVRALESQIPWVHRKQLGRWRAYWKTVWMVMFRQKQFCNELARPVSFQDSQRFRWTTIALVYLPVLIGSLINMVNHTPNPGTEPIVGLYWSSWLWNSTLHIGGILFLFAATGVPSYFFHPRAVSVRQQNRAIALSYYACGPLCWMIFPWATGFIWLLQANDGSMPLLYPLLTLCLPPAIFAIWWLDLIHLSRRLMPQRPRRAVVVGLSIPLLWFLLAVLLLFGFPAIILYIWLIIRSLC